MDLTKIYGNKVPKKVTKKAEKRFKHFAKKFEYDEKDFPKLAAYPMPNGFEDFNLYSVLDKRTAGDGSSPIDSKNGIVLGTIRMGFGHCRMALALASAAKALGYTPYWLDLMSFPESAGSKTIKYLEDWYNVGSRLSQKCNFFNKHIWEFITSDAGRNLTYSVKEAGFSKVLTPLYHDIPKNIPFLSTHPWTGHAAVAAGLKNIVSIIPDNFPLAFHVVEGSTHCVQSPSSYMGYRTLNNMDDDMTVTKCMPDKDLILTGHYIDHEIVANIEEDCAKRLSRIKKHETRRLLLTMGGAGAQVMHFAQITRDCEKEIANQKVALFINMGDHKGRWESLKKEFEKDKIEWTLHSDWEETKKFVQKSAKTKVTGIHVFLHDNFYAAVYATNILMRISDVMITKPSELSFYPVPKLFIQRVGRHEAWGAIRGSEIGDGTIETDSPKTLKRTLDLLINEDDLLTIYCEHIIRNKKDGIYNGAYNAINTAVALSKGKKPTDSLNKIVFPKTTKKK